MMIPMSFLGLEIIQSCHRNAHFSGNVCCFQKFSSTILCTISWERQTQTWSQWAKKWKEKMEIQMYWPSNWPFVTMEIQPVEFNERWNGIWNSQKNVAVVAIFDIWPSPRREPVALNLGLQYNANQHAIILGIEWGPCTTILPKIGWI